MRPKNKKANFIIIWSIILLLILVIIIQILIITLKNKEQPQNNISIGNGTTKDVEVKTVKEIIEPVKQDSFQCAAEFYCALLGS